MKGVKKESFTGNCIRGKTGRTADTQRKVISQVSADFSGVGVLTLGVYRRLYIDMADLLRCRIWFCLINSLELIVTYSHLSCCVRFLYFLSGRLPPLVVTTTIIIINSLNLLTIILFSSVNNLISYCARLNIIYGLRVFETILKLRRNPFCLL